MVNCSKCGNKIKWYQRKAIQDMGTGYYTWKETYHLSCIIQKKRKKKDSSDNTNNLVYS